MLKLTREDWCECQINDIVVNAVGFCYYDGRLYSGLELAKLFFNDGNLSIDRIDHLLESICGSFALVIQMKMEVVIIADIIRSIPVFYRYSGAFIQIGDRVFDILDKDHCIDIENAEYYLSSFMSFGPTTIYSDVYAIQAGEYVRIDLRNSSVVNKQYFNYIVNPNLDASIDVFKYSDELDKLFLLAIKRVIDSAPNVNNWIIPLSGGHDSRIIAYYFHKLGVRNVICFSYGREDGLQARISQEVAKRLGYRWEFIKINRALVEQIHKGGYIDQFIDESFMGCSTVDMQNFIPMIGLMENGIISKNDVFVPGHALDFIAGSKSEDFTSIELVEEKLISKSTNWAKSEVVEKRISEFVDGFDEKEYPIISELFGWHGRQSKYIVNSVRAYELFGFEWRLPFWDRELVCFFCRTPLSLRINRKLFFECEEQIYKKTVLETVLFDTNQTKSEAFNVRRFANYFKRKLFSAFGIHVPTLLDEGYNLLFSSNNLSVRDFLCNSNGVLQQRLFKPFYQKRISELHINKIISLIIFNKYIK